MFVITYHQVHRLGKRTVQELGRALAHLHDAALQFQPRLDFSDGMVSMMTFVGAPNALRRLIHRCCHMGRVTSPSKHYTVNCIANILKA